MTVYYDKFGKRISADKVRCLAISQLDGSKEDIKIKKELISNLDNQTLVEQIGGSFNVFKKEEKK
jgi:hypothetical protein